ncbi:60S ribosomal protein L35a-1, variant 2 [Dionaea muscipula]
MSEDRFWDTKGTIEEASFMHNQLMGSSFFHSVNWVLFREANGELGAVFLNQCGVLRCRSKSNQYPNTSLIQIEGVNTKEEVSWYQGKRMAFIYKAKAKNNGSHYRCIWGKVIRPHGNSGVVRAKFKTNLPPKSMGAKVRVFMYPSNI